MTRRTVRAASSPERSGNSGTTSGWRWHSGFTPGKFYEVIYTARNPPVVGLGLAATRDLISFLKYTNDGITLLGDQYRYLKRAIGFGTSQSGRFLRTFLYFGFNIDESGRRVFDGVWPHVASAGRGSFNHRFAQPSRDGHRMLNTFYPSDLFPFADLQMMDPETKDADGLLSLSNDLNVQPRIFYTNGAYEYWGRAASLIHTSVDGRKDDGIWTRHADLFPQRHPAWPRIISAAQDRHGLPLPTPTTPVP